MTERDLDDDEVEHHTDRIEFWWTCGACGEVQGDEFDMRGKVVECETCGAKGTLRGDY